MKRALPKRTVPISRQSNQIDVGFSGLIDNAISRLPEADLMTNAKPGIEELLRQSLKIFFRRAAKLVEDPAIRREHIKVDDV